MIGALRRLLGRAEATVSDAGPRDAAAIAALHAIAFRRGWSEAEVESLLLDRQVVAHRLLRGGKFAGFILSRCAADEAEILSVAVAPRERGRGFGARLLDWHLRRLAASHTRTVFLEVDERNQPARHLYARAGFREVAQRPRYYAAGTGEAAAALVLRRDLG